MAFLKNDRIRILDRILVLRTRVIRLRRTRATQECWALLDVAEELVDKIIDKGRGVFDKGCYIGMF